MYTQIRNRKIPGSFQSVFFQPRIREKTHDVVFSAGKSARTPRYGTERYQETLADTTPEEAGSAFRYEIGNSSRHITMHAEKFPPLHFCYNAACNRKITTPQVCIICNHMQSKNLYTTTCCYGILEIKLSIDIYDFSQGRAIGPRMYTIQTVRKCLGFLPKRSD